MDDRLQRRLRAADPLAAGTGETPTPAQLDATKERILMHEIQQPIVPARSNRPTLPVGLGAFAVIAIAAIVVVGQFARPATTLAFDPSPSPVTDAQRAAATTACGQGLVLGAIEGAGGVDAPSDGQPMSGTIEDLTPVVVPDAPAAAGELPPLVALELHGTGAVAVFASDDTVATCMLMADGLGWVRGPVTLGPTAASAPGIAASGVSVTEFEGQTITVVSGTAPVGAATMRIEGGSADGATATVTNGGYGIWIPGDASADDATLVALDPSGAEIAELPLLTGPMRGLDDLLEEASAAPQP